MKLNVCCGNRVIAGYTGVDVDPAGNAVELVAPAWALPCGDKSIDEIICIHGWEHFTLWECDKVIAEWVRVLKPGGRLILEMPDLLKCARNLIVVETGNHHTPKADQMSMWGIYGNATLENELMLHRWGWHPRSLTEYLAARGFTSIAESATTFHPVGRHVRDMRIEAMRPL